MLTAVVGTNWGDEGKGRMVDLLSEKYNVVIRYQGGNNAGHTVVNEKGKFILNLLPSGILRDETVNVMGPGMVIDVEHLYHEVDSLYEKGIEITPKHLVISDRATICMPYHKMRDILEEERLADKKFGSTRRGIAPVYADKYMKKTIRMGDLLDKESSSPGSDSSGGPYVGARLAQRDRLIQPFAAAEYLQRLGGHRLSRSYKMIHLIRIINIQ